jgi:predicted GNAT family N-acyltransferase
MVVLPEYQGRGFGKRLLQGLIEAAIEREAKIVVLNARVMTIPFYQKSGFIAVGEVFSSSATGVPHLKMQKEILILKMGL